MIYPTNKKWHELAYQLHHFLNQLIVIINKINVGYHILAFSQFDVKIIYIINGSGGVKKLF